MRNVSHSALVLHSASQMFALVDDIEAYPRFLPWCTGTTVHSRNNDIVEASIEMHRGLIRTSFSTRNTLRPHEAIDIALLAGPFRHLAGGWRFEQLGELGSKVSLDLEFEFEHRLTSIVFEQYFENICNSLVDAFIARAGAVHGR